MLTTNNGLRYFQIGLGCQLPTFSQVWLLNTSLPDYLSTKSTAIISLPCLLTLLLHLLLPAANQALIALVAQLTEMVQDVIQLLLQEEKMELSWKIACEVNDVIHTYGKEASYVPPGLLSLAAEIFCTQRCTTQLVEVPDWTHLGNNQDMCMKHPLYSKTLGAAPPIASAAPVATAPVPAPPPAPTPALAPPLAPAPARDASIHMPRHAASGETTPAGSSTTWKHQLSTSPPVPCGNQSRKPVIKSKAILSNTDTTSDTEKVKGKGKAKAKAKALEVDGDEDNDMIDVNDLLDVQPRKSMCKAVIPANKQGTLKASQLVVNDDDEEEDELEEDEEAQGRSKQQKLVSSTQSNGKATSRKTKVQELPRTDGPLPPCERCQVKKVECCPQLTKKGNVASTCTLCHDWKMACIWPDTESATITPTTDTAPPVAAVTTRSKTTWSKATSKKMVGKSNAKEKKIQQPSPIEEKDNNIEMFDSTVGVMGAHQQSAPLVSADDFPVDHWIEPGTDKLPPPAPSLAMASEDNIQFSPLPVIHSPPTQHPLSHDQMEAMSAQIRCRMDLTEASDGAMSMQVDELQQDMHVQHALLSECTAEHQLLLPAFNPPPITAPGPSISAFACTVTNNVFTPDVSWMGAQTSGDAFSDTADGSPVARLN
ncbi:uncharacterized protein BJ212DRAFT_1480232 [Suillus subaureus]|uniref:Zn(2)-C6 fungal-type domain-containing protein n=1 Tax=Suillus subaureus TaxID=48587 RepID=A0A9P7ECG0_9AGAM|nr:uncharacterized protein BJ212DRAFT_1480232 [Suillus subaureus]KAG1817675.1 hypothetical protein BJ212DRAFT_1480232 [Suillus subaureus]